MKLEPYTEELRGCPVNAGRPVNVCRCMPTESGEYVIE